MKHDRCDFPAGPLSVDHLADIAAAEVNWRTDEVLWRAAQRLEKVVSDAPQWRNWMRLIHVLGAMRHAHAHAWMYRTLRAFENAYPGRHIRLPAPEHIGRIRRLVGGAERHLRAVSATLEERGISPSALAQAEPHIRLRM